MSDNDIVKNIEIIRSKIDQALRRSNRNVSDVKLVAVSKTVDIERIMMAYEAGIRDFGENYVQEMLQKIERLPLDINWHFIGHLQSNKIKHLVSKVRLIQTVCKIEHLGEIDKRSQIAQVVSNLLIEINLGGEESKSGTDAEGAIEIVKKSLSFKHLKVVGLMCIPPVSEPEQARKFFKNLHFIKDRINNSFGMEVIKELSMGMSSDFEVAIEEGATIVRVGTAIFGIRGGKK